MLWKRDKNKSQPIESSSDENKVQKMTKKMAQINGWCNVCTYPSKYCDSDFYNCGHKATNWYKSCGVVCKDVVLKSMGKNTIGELLCFETSSKVRWHDLT